MPPCLLIQSTCWRSPTGKRSHWEKARWPRTAKTLVISKAEVPSRNGKHWQLTTPWMKPSCWTPITDLALHRQDPERPSSGSDPWLCFKRIQNAWQFGSCSSSPLFCNKFQSKSAKKGSSVHGFLIVFPLPNWPWRRIFNQETTR